ncbi:MAG: hypothetical protein WCD51_01010 [Anaerolineae bacterium]
MDMGSCRHRSVSIEGRITCDKIAAGDNEVHPALCHQCPARRCDCQHLRFALEKIVLTPVTVRWATGVVEVWDNQPPSVSFLRSACSLETTPVVSPDECLARCLRLSWQMEASHHHTVPDATTQLADNVLPFIRRPHKQPGVPCTLA